MVNRLATAQSTVAIRHWRPAAIVTLVTAAALTALTADAAPKQARPQPQEATAPRPAGEPIMAIVSIKTQQVTFYDADGWILRAPVSTGTTERETPAGVFAVVEKKVDHRSNMYDDAHMPHMQRITWNGIALHGGPLPGYAASHGCVRMPFGFADRVFGKTRIGMRVIVAPNDPTPVDF
jgi:lipoprotein-anchoring transpeptidase ErfK/SrfK